MPESRKYKGKRYTVVIPQTVAEKLEFIATKETRSFSSMIAILVEEAIKTRESKDS